MTIGNSVTSIGDYVFRGCNSLTSITIPNSVTLIGRSAFLGCSSLTSLTIGNSVTSIAYNSFSGCSNLTSVTLNCKNIGKYWFDRMESIKEVILGEEVMSIGEYAFRGCSGLTSLTIGKSVTSINCWAFIGCISITSVTFNCKYVGRDFSGMDSIKEVFLGDGVISIGEDAFSDCDSITSVTFGNSVTSIGKYAFRSCSNLTTVCSLNVKPPEINEETFSDETYKNATLYVSKGSKTLYCLHPYWKKFFHIEEFESTNVESIMTNKKEGKVNFNVYNLNGQRMPVKADNINSLPKGIYIVNGKKVIVK